VLADGRVTMCDQDFRGRHTVGRIAEQTLEEIWRGDELERLRAAHDEGSFESIPLCSSCDEWHRP
jgi:radical SAM protein with 4Fe4S-binding SPASM domain